MILDTEGIQTFLAEVSREDDFLQELDNLNDAFPGRQRRVAKMMQGYLAMSIGCDNLLGDFGQLMSQFEPFQHCTSSRHSINLIFKRKSATLSNWLFPRTLAIVCCSGVLAG